MQGTVINLVLDRGFGFISPSDGGRNVFFHSRDLQGIDFDGYLLQRQVQFRLGTDYNSSKPRAYDVTPERS